MTDQTSYETPKRRSLWRRIVDWLRGDSQPVAPPEPAKSFVPAKQEKVEYQPSSEDEPMTVLCQGDVFEFQVYVDLLWSTHVMPYEELTHQAREYTASARDTVRERAWKVARAYSPYQAVEAEAAIQAELDSGWCYSDDAGLVRCTAKVRVLPDPRVREHLRPFSLLELEVEAEASLGRLRVERLGELTHRWQKLFEEIGHGPTVVHAAQMTKPDFATVVARLAGQRRDSATKLIDLLHQTTKDHQHLGLYEFANAYDSALQAFRKQMGLDDSLWSAQPSSVDSGPGTKEKS
ncbi:hypothetical protein GCM10027290_38470 [Micromonospora sonneratiae]|uniref:Uncharacterized protein n=1 Tax=Micromonospora sonneratiae TaxID=1184706 RepID=A0ABW3YA63_9ACTN